MVTASIFLFVLFSVWSLSQSAWGQSEGDLRLVGRESSGSLGRVEVFWKGKWGTICDRNYNGVAGTVCYQLNQSVRKSRALNATSVKRMNKSLKENQQELITDSSNGAEIVLRDVDCGPIHSVPPVMLHILQCNYTVVEGGSARGGCSHDDDLAVHCAITSVISDYTSGESDNDDASNSDLYASEVRLVGGNFSSIGTLEVYLNQKWGNVCYKGFEQASADTICRQMGYTHAQRFFPTTENTTGVVWLKESKSAFNCSGQPWPCLYYCFKGGDRRGKLDFNRTTCPDGRYVAVQCSFDPRKRDEEGFQFGNPVKCALQRKFSKTPAYVVAIMSASGCFWTITSAIIVIVAISFGVKSCPCYRLNRKNDFYSSIN